MINGENFGTELKTNYINPNLCCINACNVVDDLPF